MVPGNKTLAVTMLSPAANATSSDRMTHRTGWITKTINILLGSSIKAASNST
jgi:hypothetical protein